MILPPPAAITTSLFPLIDSTGVFVGALGGALASRRDTRFNFDYVGIIGLGMISGVGGGLARAAGTSLSAVPVPGALRRAGGTAVRLQRGAEDESRHPGD